MTQGATSSTLTFALIEQARIVSVPSSAHAIHLSDCGSLFALAEAASEIISQHK